MTPQYDAWARQRIKSGAAADLSILDISGTEWPLFGSVFYLWATQALQEQYTQGQLDVDPSRYAGEAVESAYELVMDPNHAGWVRQHWGDDYLIEENAFYRMLRISALVSHYHLTQSKDDLPTMQTEVDELVKDIDASPHGLLEDYPYECYPADVLTAIAAIRRANRILGKDDKEFIQRSIRGFQGDRLDDYGMVPYAADVNSGFPYGPSRGCGNSYVCLSAPELWPEQAKKWYDLYEQHFWQSKWGAVGFREFAKAEKTGDWYFDVDAGPVIAGHGFAADAFGVGAALINGRFDHSFPLICEVIAFSWPLPDGTLAIPRFLSNSVEAPYLGEAAILYNLTRSPAPGLSSKTGGHIPPICYAMLAVYFLPGLLLLASAVRKFRSISSKSALTYPLEKLQLVLWVVVVTSSIISAIVIPLRVTLVLLLFASMLPLGFRRKKKREDEPDAQSAS
ncbi:hypothetical protein JXA32_04125 [Candidatus Sumerlaeota bacterium]|nr:hypothetical protein [Candidatus Sumerlaeota bacterium]